MNLPLIEINLSEEFTRKKKRGGLSLGVPKQLPLVAGAVGAVALVGLAVFYMVVSAKSRELTDTNNRINKIKQDVLEYDSLTTRQAKLNDRKNKLADWTGMRITIAERWLRLAQILPRDLYLTEIDFDAKDDKEQKMIVRGSASTNEERLIVTFLNFLRSDAEFSNVFKTATLSPVTTDRDEKKFSIELARVMRVAPAAVPKPKAAVKRKAKSAE